MNQSEAGWVMLKDLCPGAVFVTREGIYAVKSEYFYTGDSQSQCECVLLASGEYAHFRDGNRTLVREVSVEGLAESVTGPSTELLGERDHFAGFAKLETEEICNYLYFSSVDKETIAIVRPYINTFLAQRAYDLVQHALTMLDLPERINSIPDLTE